MRRPLKTLLISAPVFLGAALIGGLAALSCEGRTDRPESSGTAESTAAVPGSARLQAEALRAAAPPSFTAAERATLAAAHGGVVPGNAPPSHATPMGAAALAGHVGLGGPVSGTVVTAPVVPVELALSGSVALGPALAAAVKPGSVLFLSVRQDAPDGLKGRLLAARRVDIAGAQAFPVAFQLTSADLMGPGVDLGGALRVEARIDQDGDAMSRSPGDLYGRTPTPVQSGPGRIEILVDQKL